MNITADVLLRAFEARVKSNHAARGLLLWVGAIRDLIHAIQTQHATERRDAYGQLMLAETELQQLSRELADSPRNARSYQPTAAIGSILERIYAAKGILACLLLIGILHAEISPYVDDPERARVTRVIKVRRPYSKDGFAA